MASWRRGQDARRTELRAAMRALPSADALLQSPRQRLDACADRLPRALRANAQVHRTHFSRVAAPLTARMLRDQVERRRERFASLTVRFSAGMRANAQARREAIARARERTGDLLARASRAMKAAFDRRTARLERASGLLAALSYQGVLARGFALVRDAHGTPLRGAAAASPGLALDIEFADGHVAATVNGAAGSPSSSVTKPKQKAAKKDQGSLF
jgi:exodeoxyribonuclease VII large subunit